MTVTAKTGGESPGIRTNVEFARPPAGDRGRSRQDFAKVNRNVHDVIDPGFEQLQRVLEHFQAAHGDDGSRRSLAHRPRQTDARIHVPEQEGIDRCQVRLAC